MIKVKKKINWCFVGAVIMIVICGISFASELGNDGNGIVLFLITFWVGMMVGFSWDEMIYEKD